MKTCRPSASAVVIGAALGLTAWTLQHHGGESVKAASAITFVQSASTAQTGGQTASNAFPGSVTSGDLIIVGVFVDPGAAVSVTDSLGSSFTQVAHQTVASDHDADVFVATAGSECAATSRDLLVKTPLALKTGVAVSQRLELMRRQALRLPSRRQARMSFHFPRAPLKPQCPPSARVSTWPFANFHASSHKGWLRLGLNTSHAMPAARNSKMLQLPCKLSLSGLFPICGPSLIGFQLPS